MEELKDVRVLANKIMFDYQEDEVDLAQKEFDEFLQLVTIFDDIDCEELEPLTFPYQVETTYLREDEPIHTASQSDILRNANSIKEDQIKIDKVV